MASVKQTKEYTTFTKALKQVLRVSKHDLNRMLAEEKVRNQGKPKRGPKPKRPSTSGHVSGKND